MSLQSISTPPGNPHFVNLDEKYTCIVCHNVCRDAMQTSCGHRVCDTCWPLMFEGKSEPVPCPVAEEDCLPQMKSDISPDPSGRREIRRLKVHCSFRNVGCQKTVQWQELENHTSNCEFRLRECPNKQYGCNDPVPFKFLKQHAEQECHFRPNPCQYCGESVPSSRQEDHLLNSCRKVPLRCPYNCGAREMLRDEMERHVQECVNRPLECKFKTIGCAFVGNEKQVTEHMLNDVNHHLEKITVFTGSMDLQSMQLRNQLEAVTSERDTLRREVQELRTELNSHKQQIDTLKNSTKDLKMKMVSLTERTIHIERKSEDMVKKEVVEKYDRDMRAVNTTVSQLKEKVDRIGNQPGRGGSAAGGGRPQDIAGVNTKVEMHDQQFAQLDVQLAELDLRFQVLETASYDGTLLWKLRDYTRRKQEAISDKTLSLYSQPFYTHRYGYKMCARVYLNGDGMGKGSHLSLFFVVMRGEYDNLLQWPFPCKVTMILLDQESGQAHLSDTFRPDPNSSSFRKPTSEMNIASGCPLFVSHTVLETRKFIHDDTLFIKFEVDISNAPHP